MPKIENNVLAPDFSMKDFTGKLHRLSDYTGQGNVLLVFNRGFL